MTGNPLGRSLADMVAHWHEHGAVVAEQEDAEHREHLAASAARARADAWLGMCPRRFHDVSWEWLAAEHPPAVTDALLAWTSIEPRPNLVLLGPVGTGKSGTAVLACDAEWNRRGQAMAFWPSVELLDGLRPDGGLSIDRLVSVPRLVVDDLGAEKPTEWAMERLYALLNRRWLDEHATIVTSNLTPDLLRDAVGERLYSRLVGDGAVVVRLGGGDRRRTSTRKARP